MLSRSHTAAMPNNFICASYKPTFIFLVLRLVLSFSLASTYIQHQIYRWIFPAIEIPSEHLSSVLCSFESVICARCLHFFLLLECSKELITRLSLTLHNTLCTNMRNDFQRNSMSYVQFVLRVEILCAWTNK